MLKKERQKEIERLLHEQGELHIAGLCRKFQITEMTARRDLAQMQERHVLIRTHGGAIAMEKKTYDAQTPLYQRLKTANDEKQEIAKSAKELVHAHDVIFLGSGSTVDIFADTLLQHVPLTIMTDALNIAIKLHQDPHLQIIVSGGELRSRSLTLTGRMSEHNLAQFQLQRAFIGINGIDEDGVLYVSSIVESGLLEVLFQQVDEIYVLAHSSKLQRKDLVKITSTKPYTLITSTKSDSQLLAHYRSCGIRIR